MNNIIGVIGAGSLGTQLVRMFVKSKLTVLASTKDVERRQKIMKEFYNKAYTYDDNSSLVKTANIIFLSVKPNQVEEVCKQIAPRLKEDTPIISTAAGVPLHALHKWLPNSNLIIRCMPNVLCDIGQGTVTHFSHNDKSVQLMKNLFDPNLSIPLQSDSQIDASTFASGCAPAFIAWYFQCMKQTIGRKIPEEELNSMLIQAMIGTGYMLQNVSPSEIATMVASPKGATEAGLNRLFAEELDQRLIDAFFSSLRRINDIASKF